LVVIQIKKALSAVRRSVRTALFALSRTGRAVASAVYCELELERL